MRVHAKPQGRVAAGRATGRPRSPARVTRVVAQCFGTELCGGKSQTHGCKCSCVHAHRPTTPPTPPLTAARPCPIYALQAGSRKAHLKSPSSPRWARATSVLGTDAARAATTPTSVRVTPAVGQEPRKLSGRGGGGGGGSRDWGGAAVTAHCLCRMLQGGYEAGRRCWSLVDVRGPCPGQCVHADWGAPSPSIVATAFSQACSVNSVSCRHWQARDVMWFGRRV